MTTVLKFDTREAASSGAAARIAGTVGSELERDDIASLVVSGGTTPAQCFEFLSGYDLNWDKVQVVLSDERWVPRNHKDSNERMVRTALLKDQAAPASVLPIYQKGLSMEERCESLQSLYPENGFACSMIGMGVDGHFASLFPNSDSLEAGLSLATQSFYIPIRTAASPHPRVSMTLSAMLKSDEIVLLMFGTEKLAVFERAEAGDAAYPIAALLEQQQVPVSLYWAP